MLDNGKSGVDLVLMKQELLAVSLCLEAGAVYRYFGKLGMFYLAFSTYNLF